MTALDKDGNVLQARTETAPEPDRGFTLLPGSTVTGRLDSSQLTVQRITETCQDFLRTVREHGHIPIDMEAVPRLGIGRFLDEPAFSVGLPNLCRQAEGRALRPNPPPMQTVTFEATYQEIKRRIEETLGLQSRFLGE